jgi:hypothetical protein
MINSRSTKWAGNVAGMGEKRNVFRVSVLNFKERDHWGNLGLDERIILKWIYEKSGGWLRTKVICFRKRTIRRIFLEDI